MEYKTPHKSIHIKIGHIGFLNYRRETKVEIKTNCYQNSNQHKILVVGVLVLIGFRMRFLLWLNSWLACYATKGLLFISKKLSYVICKNISSFMAMHYNVMSL